MMMNCFPAGSRRIASVLVALLCAAVSLPAQSLRVPQTQAPPQAAPPAPPVEVRQPGVLAQDLPEPQGGAILYSIGEPTAEEQYHLELVNRSRANPTAEGVRLANTSDPDVLSAYNSFSVNLSLMQFQFSTNPAVPPVAMNAQLLEAARVHSLDMFYNQFQQHTGSDGSNPGSRISAQGYNWMTYGENIYAYAKSPFHGYAGLNVDWGTGSMGSVGGMQNPPGHRDTIHSAAFREVGIGVVNGVNGTVGPHLLTQNFATRQSATPLITGVAYYDFNGNGFYDVGEGIGGVTVDAPGSPYYAITTESGGYAIPVTTNGNYVVTFAASGLNTQTVATVTSQRNVKVDLVPAYCVISGPAAAVLNQANTYTFPPVIDAESYDWERSRWAPYTAVEGAESGLANVTADVSGGYQVVISEFKASGNYSFHLAHPAPPVTQSITLNPALRLGTKSQLTFAKKLSWATSVQVARAQISTNNGASWITLWSQAGTGGAGDAAFTRITNSLNAYAGHTIRVRFAYELTGGSYFPQADADVGFCFDDIAVSNAEQLTDAVVTAIPAGTSFTLTPTNTSSQILRVRAHRAGVPLPWGPSREVAVVTAVPALQLAGPPALNGTQIQIEFTVANPVPGMTFELWRATDAGGPWSVDGGASFETTISASRFQVTTSTGGATQMLYRVRAVY